jgi:hypothetical protein
MIMWVDQAEMPHLWQVIWFQLAKLEGDRLCKNQGEVWQYMGSKIEQDKLTHTFRHRCYPKSFNQEYRHISTTLAGEVIE